MVALPRVLRHITRLTPQSQSPSLRPPSLPAPLSPSPSLLPHPAHMVHLQPEMECPPMICNV